MGLCRYSGFRLESGDKTFFFYRHHFYELIVGLATKKDYAQNLADKIKEGKDFNIGDIVVKYTSSGCIWKSPRRKVHKTFGQVIRLSHDSVSNLYYLLKNETYDRFNLGYYPTGKGVKKARRVRYTRRYTFLFCFLFDIRIAYYVILPPMFFKSYQRCRNNKFPRKRQIHGSKTISNHYLKCLANNMELVENEPP